MGGGGKGGGGGKSHDYYGTIAGLICAGPVDALIAIICDGKTVWPEAAQGDWKTGKSYTAGDMVRSISRVWVAASNHTSSSANAPGVDATWTQYVITYSGTNPSLISVSGYGTAVFYWGTATQTLSADVPTIQATHPPYRRQCFAILKDWLFGRERVSAPNVEFVVRRAPVQSVITGDAADLDSDGQVNLLAFAAEQLTDPIFGLGRPGLADAPSWQTAADALTAEAATTHLSPVLDRASPFRAFGGAFGAYHDGFFRGTAAGLIEAGLYPRDTAAPTFTAATTIDVHDAVEEIGFSAEGPDSVKSEVSVAYTDSARSYKSRTARAQNSLNRDTATAGSANGDTLDRPWITRAAHAADHAARWLRQFATPGITGTIVVRKEKAASIEPGDVFLLQHAALNLQVPCRCESKVLSAPPAARATLRFSSERTLTPSQIHTGDTGSGDVVNPDPEEITLYQFAQTPPELTGGDPNRVTVLAARTQPMTIGLRVHLQKQDSTLFYDLGAQEQWAIAGVLQQDYDDTHPADGTEPPDDDTEDLRVTMDPATLPADLLSAGETQTLDGIDDNAMLVWIFSAADPTQFEILTLKEIRLDGSDYALKVRRARLGTTKKSFLTGDRAFIIRRENVSSYGHDRFSEYGITSAPATFRLQSYNPWNLADLTDAAVCPDITFDFADPYAPAVEWLAIQQRPNATTAWADITVFTSNFDPTTDFRVAARLTDPTGDLSLAVMSATAGNLSQPLLNVPVASSSQDVEAVFKLPEGDWAVVMQVTDETGRVVARQLADISGGTPVVLQVHPTGSSRCANPVASPSSKLIASSISVSLSCSTPSSTIKYRIVPYRSTPSGSWLTYTTPLVIQPQSTLYAYAQASGFTDSPEVQNDYRLKTHYP